MRRIGRADPICRCAFARLYKPVVIGTYSFWKPGWELWKEEARYRCECETRKAVPRTGRPTCPRLPALKVCKDRTL